jgi:hypothetical protein
MGLGPTADAVGTASNPGLASVIEADRLFVFAAEGPSALQRSRRLDPVNAIAKDGTCLERYQIAGLMRAAALAHPASTVTSG